jgi:hypothetical protein
MRFNTLMCLSVATLLAAGALAMGPGGNGKKDSQISLVRPDDPPDADAKGTLRIRHKGNGDSLEVHVMQVTEGHEHHLWMEDGIDLDTFSDVGTLDGDGGSQQLKFDTKKGGVLPLAAASLDDLIGRRVEVRHDDAVVLLGVVPPWDLSKKPHKAKVAIDAPDGAPAPDMHGTLSLRGKDDKGQERIDLKAKKVPFDDGPFHVFVEEGVGLGTFVDSGKLEKTDEHEGRWKRDTKKGQALPDGVFFVSELADRLIEVRRDSDGTVYLRGTIPLVK